MENKIVDNILSFLKESGEIALKLQNTSFGMKYKFDSSIVTKTDIRISKLFKKKVKEFFDFGNYIILDEENLQDKEIIFENKHEYLWTIDPIDGTNTYFHGFPMWATAIALYKDFKPYISFIYLPVLREIVYTDSFKSYFITNAFLPNECKIELKTNSKKPINRSIILQHKLKNFQHTKYSILDLYSSYVSGFYTLTNRSIASFFNRPAKLWDITALLPIAINLKLSFKNIDNRKDLKKISKDIVEEDWGLKNTFLLCNKKYYNDIMEIF